MGRRDVKFEYYRVYAREYNHDNDSNGERVLCDISPLLEKASKIDISNREYEVNGEISRLQEIKQDDLEPNIWTMNFLRMRDVVPGIAKRNTSAYNLISLEDDEYVGEEITVLYDKNSKIIMIQRNRNSLSPSGLEKYFTGVADNGMLIEFLPIPMPDQMKEIPNSAIIKKASVSFCPTKLDNELLGELSNGWKAIFKGAKQLGATNATIMISVGNSRRQEKALEKMGVLSLSSVKDSDAMNRIKLIKKDDMDTNVEIVDLIEGKLYDIKSFEYSRTNPIEYNRIYPIMKLIYNGRKDMFKVIFGDEL